MSDVFISYRREFDAGWAGRLATDLTQAFAERRVFHDIASIEIGEDFVDAMRRSLSACAVVVVVMGPRWLGTQDEQGRRRLDDPDDYVRLELEESMKRDGLRVVPVLVGGALMPRSAELPESLRLFARRNAAEIADKRWNHDVAQLVAALRKIPALASSDAPATKAAAAIAVPAEPVARRAPALEPVARNASPPAVPVVPPGSVFRDGDNFPEMVVIPAGRFMMGRLAEETGRDAELPRHSVTIAQPFALAKHAVTFDEWDAFVATDGTAYKPADKGWGRGRQPVINVSWEDAQAYAAWVSDKTGKLYRLPSEAQWEYAARAGTTTRYPWGDAPGKNQANFSKSGSPWSDRQTAPVGGFPPNQFGLCDMIGNVWEWTQDCWNDNYNGAPEDGNAWEAGNCGVRVVRGGSWSSSAGNVRVAFRFRFKPAFRDINLGFRLARTL